MYRPCYERRPTGTRGYLQRGTRVLLMDGFAQLYRYPGKISRYERPEAWGRRVAIKLAVREVKRFRVREVLQLM
jgi:hypothetical protein